MQTYVYEGINDEGMRVRGLVQAENQSLALNQLKNFRLQVRYIQKQTKLGSLFYKLRGVTQGALTIFTRQLSTMIESGLPLMRSLDILSTRGENRRLEEVILLLR